ncbi:hypothetical protein ACFYSC_01200 [Streptosporangium sp. NPDC004379]|uniref:hypothetical protein n=1 Tax=Streptosporangium sp. NPDC004379 TaxID=3366189 RepID=UPI00369F6124
MFTGPPGLMMIPLAAFACACLLYGASAPGGHLTEVGSGILLGLTVAVAWVPRFLAGLLRPEGRPGLLRHRARWAALPVMGAVTAALIGFHVPYDVRFALSEPGLERLAQEMTAGNGPAYHEGWVGLYPVYARRVDGDVIFMVRNTGFLGTHGFAWSPPGGPPHRHEGGYTHLRGPWYEWRADF